MGRSRPGAANWDISEAGRAILDLVQEKVLTGLDLVRRSNSGKNRGIYKSLRLA